MGCCCSTPSSNQHQNGLKHHQPQLRSSAPKPNESHGIQSRVPPPQPVEEESVKEVLSETPISKPHQVPVLTAEMNAQMPNIQHRRRKVPAPFINKTCSMSDSFSEEVSQISETCNMNESFSTTSTVTEKREDEATSKRSTREGTQGRNRKRSYTIDGNRIGVREQRRPKSPAPEKIPVSSQSVRRKESGQVRRDPGEGPLRRSRSPSSARTVDAAGAGRGQMKPPQGGAGRRLPPAKGGEKEKVEEENDVIPREESLENPHVSLECFIFL